MDILNEVTWEVKKEVVIIKSDYIPKYCNECKMQGHNTDECRNDINNKDTRNKEIEERRVQNQQPQVPTIPYNHMMQKGKARVLSSGIVVGDPGEWKIIKDGRYKPPITQTPHPLNNSFVVLADESTMSAINSLNNNKASPMANTSNNNKYNEVSKWQEYAQAAPIRSHDQDIVSTKKPTDNTTSQDDKAIELATCTEEIKQNQKYLAIEEKNQCDRQECLTLDIDVDNTNIIEGLICPENDMAIVEISEPMKTLMVYSPNMTLPNIISHNIREEGCSIIDQNQISIGVVEIEESEELWDIPLKADISPKLLKSAKNRKKDGSGENVQPTRIQPRRNK
ncbi:hypothetical protein KY284_030409 [Solanum tuberosum]|nr:hypothetical protein KY284_030409 [Solanum tuberosum]